MAQFATETRKWLESAIKQRRFLLRIDKSHKDEREVYAALHLLTILLQAYRYENDLYMARFVLSNKDYISMILPGTGSGCFGKKRDEFTTLLSNSKLIADSFYGLNKKTQYEINF